MRIIGCLRGKGKGRGRAERRIDGLREMACLHIFI